MGRPPYASQAGQPKSAGQGFKRREIARADKPDLGIPFPLGIRRATVGPARSGERLVRGVQGSLGFRHGPGQVPLRPPTMAGGC